jgi:hypothetical protein
VIYLIWSNQHCKWWGPGGIGYTPWIEEAGRYAEAHARRIVADATVDGQLRHPVTGRFGVVTVVDEVMVPAPETVPTDRPAAPRVAAQGEAGDVGTSPVAGVPPCSGGAPAQDPDSPPYASPMAYRAVPVHERGWVG